MLISQRYLDQQRELHADPKGYGGKGAKWAETVADLLVRLNLRSVLDYGCGQGSLGRALRTMGHPVADYDPAIPDKAASPAPADLVVCTDVLEHVEPDCLDAVLDDIARCTRHAAFVVVSLVPAGKVLADGRNAHILLQPAEWWAARLGGRFRLAEVGPVRAVKGHKEFAAVWRPL